jgi:hypothetical protein
MPGRIVPEPPSRTATPSTCRTARAGPQRPPRRPGRAARRGEASDAELLRGKLDTARGLLDEVRQAEERLLGDTGA